MKLLTHTLIIGMALLLSSCNSATDEELPCPEAPVPIRFALRAETRAPISTINSSNLSGVGIYGAVEGSTSGQFPWTTTPFVSNLVPSAISGSQLSFAAPLYYPAGGRRVKFYGYYPRTTNTLVAPATNYIVPPAAGVAPIYHFALTGQEDIMQAVSTPSGSTAPATVALTFTHKLAQIQLNVSLLGSLLIGIKVLGVTTSGSMNVETGVVTYDPLSTNAISFTFPSLLAPVTNPLMVPAGVTSYIVEASLSGLVPIRRFQITSTTGSFKAGVLYTIQL